MSKKISIIGCGWLGMPLASALVRIGHSVKGSTTSVDKMPVLKKAGILPFLVTISENGISGTLEACLKNSEILIINMPPRLRKNLEANFVKQMELLCAHVEKASIKKVLYVSSTSVYEDDISMPIITEEISPNGKSARAKQLIAAEQIFKINGNFESTILRFGGLIGPDRHPANFLSGKTGIINPESPVNLIHQHDAIGIITAIFKNQTWNTDFNAAAPQHPSRKAYYTNLCKTQNLPIPEFVTSGPSYGKIISSSKVERILNYDFQYYL